MAEAQTFPTNTYRRIKDRIAAAPHPVPTLYQGLVAEGDEIDAQRQIRLAKAAQLAKDREAIALQRHLAEKEEKKTGVAYYSETTEVDARGGKSVTQTRTGYVEKLLAEEKALTAERNALLEVKSRPNPRSLADDQLGENNAPLIPFGEPVDWKPREGEQFAEGYIREFGALNILRKDVKRIWDAPRTLAEAIPSVYAEIDALALKPPNLGGHIRGSSVAERGGLQIGNPGKRIGFVETRIGPETTTVDVVRLVAWAFKDQLKKACADYMTATYSDEGSISLANKATLIPKLESELWQQRRVVEAAYRACRAAGLRNLNRPKDSPVEILIDVIPFSKARLVRVETAQPMPNPDAGVVPAEDADAPDFEDEGNDA